MRGQGLDCESGQRSNRPLAAAADVTAELAFMANKLLINAGPRWALWAALLFIQCIPPRPRLSCLLFGGYSYLPNTHLSYFT